VVPGLDPARAREVALPGVRVLDAARHPHKLRTGQLRGNRFSIVVRDVDDRACAVAAERLERACRIGMPNRFGAQRFGRDGENVRRAQLLMREEGAAGDRRAARFLLAALQAAVFNAALAARETPLDALEAGEIAMVHASGGCFVVEDLAREAPRAAAFEISATGPIFGTRVLAPRGEAAARERAALERFGAFPGNRKPPRGIRLRGARRPLRVKPEDAAAEPGDGGLVLRFALPPGSYATVLVEELLNAESVRAERHG
jgi:tRNA pseudouridine13 synthase